MARPPSACACGQQVPVTVAGQPTTTVCARAEGHKGAHQGRVQWTPRLRAPAPPARRG
jgi:hypothetical protein